MHWDQYVLLSIISENNLSRKKRKQKLHVTCSPKNVRKMTWAIVLIG